ncbi:chemotaxis protein CheW [Geminocystis sp. GBBB08]|uniref:chemotaxis protein CheW n=1 Tax=Geminocystis sp. GBBB08 TaxID=2604140 RepID=UPI0027E30F73|nr:chemotaxis protein CheW [Geminocystis sp. GBBB08]MBL1208823.1 chemotaxis protein CheW [Geminocystis sp. GBBB08]
MSTSSSFTRLQELLPQLFQEPEFQGDAYLRIRLNTQLSALITMENIKESLSVSAEKITPIPGVPSFVMGLMSSRDSVFLVMDLAQLIGLAPLSTYNRQYDVMVLDLSNQVAPSELTSENLLIGLAVTQIQGIKRVVLQEREIREDLDNNLRTTDLTDNSKQYFYTKFESKGEELMILDLQKIFPLIMK